MTKIEQAFAHGYDLGRFDGQMGSERNCTITPFIESLKGEWSQVPPTEEGWYWYRHLLDRETIMVRLRFHPKGHLEDSDGITLGEHCDTSPGLPWWQRIEEPEPPREG